MRFPELLDYVLSDDPDGVDDLAESLDYILSDDPDNPVPKTEKIMVAKQKRIKKATARAARREEKIKKDLAAFEALKSHIRKQGDFNSWTDEYDTRSQVVSSSIPMDELKPKVDEITHSLTQAINAADYRGGSLQEDFVNLQKENEELKAKLAVISQPKPGFFAWIVQLWRKVWKKS